MSLIRKDHKPRGDALPLESGEKLEAFGERNTIIKLTMGDKGWSLKVFGIDVW
jgi:hypothetical protein